MSAGLTLGIETSTPAGGVALADADGGLRVHRLAIAKTGYSRRLIAMIDGALADAGVGKDDLAAIAVTKGPGSFTGVRVGLATAKTLAQALDIPLFLDSTLAALARRRPAEPEGLTCCVLDARRKEVYSAIYETPSDEAIRGVRAEHVEPLESLLDALASLPGDQSVRFTGDGASKNRDQIVELLGERAEFVAAPWNSPAADSVALEGARRLAAGIEPDDPLGAAPDYLRASDAEINLAKKPA